MRFALATALLAGLACAQEPDEIDDLEGLDDIMDVEADEDGAGLRVTAIKGFVETRYKSYFRDRSNNGGLKDEQWINEIELELDLSLTDELSAYFRPRFLVDLIDDDLVRTDPFELYATWTDERWDLRVGQFVENWGIADTFNPIDVLNRRDFGSDLLDPTRLGELGSRLRLLFDGGETLEEPTLSIYAMPVFQTGEFPTRRNRFSFAPTPNALREDIDVRPDGFDRWFFAARAQAVLNTEPANADLQLVAARGPDRFPVFGTSINGAGGVDFTPIYYGIWTLGGGLRAVPNSDLLADYTLKAEVVYKIPYRTETALPTELPDEYLQYAFGFDRLVPNVFSDHDQITATVEWVGEIGANDSTASFRPFDDDLVLRAFWEANDFDRTSFEIRGFLDPSSGEWVAEGIYEQQLRSLHEDLKLKVGVQVFDAARSEPGFFGLFPNNSNVEVALRFDF